MSELLTLGVPQPLDQNWAERIAHLRELEAKKPLDRPDATFDCVRDMPHQPIDTGRSPAALYDGIVQRADEVIGRYTKATAMADLAVGIIRSGGDQSPDFYIGDGTKSTGHIHELAKAIAKARLQTSEETAAEETSASVFTTMTASSLGTIAVGSI